MLPGAGGCCLHPSDRSLAYERMKKQQHANEIDQCSLPHVGDGLQAARRKVGHRS